MLKKTIAEQIVNGKTATDLGLDEAEFQARKALIEEFLRDNAWEPSAFMMWLLSQENIAVFGGEYLDSKIWERRAPPQPPSAKEMAKGFMSSAGEVITSGIKFADDKTYQARMESCQPCEFFVNKRCMRCGCYMNIKAKFAAMHCPAGKW